MKAMRTRSEASRIIWVSAFVSACSSGSTLSPDEPTDSGDEARNRIDATVNADPDSAVPPGTGVDTGTVDEPSVDGLSDSSAFCMGAAGNVQITIANYRATTYKCRATSYTPDASGRSELEFDGVILAGEAKATSSGHTVHLSLRACEGSDECDPVLVDVGVNRPTGLSITPILPPQGALVHVSYRSDSFWGCRQSIAILEPSPGDASAGPLVGKVVLIASDGFEPPDAGLHAPSSELSVQKEFVAGCSPEAQGCSLVTPGRYQFLFRSSLAGSSVVELPMGASAQWMLGAQRSTVTNLRSYQTTICDDYHNWAYEIVRSE